MQRHLNSGKVLEADLVILSIGVKPDSELARDAGLQLGPRGHIVVDEYQRTSDPEIYAAGDAVETLDRIVQGRTAVPMGGPANRQGRRGRSCHHAREGETVSGFGRDGHCAGV